MFLIMYLVMNFWFLKNYFIHYADAVVIEEWKNEVHKMEEELKALERKYIDRCSDFRVWGHLLVGCY